MIVTIRTDNPHAEICVFSGQKQLSRYKWHADRALAHDILTVIHKQLVAQKADWSDVTGVAVYEGPGSFTGLRIGITVANAIAYGQNVPIVAATGDDWCAQSVARLTAGEDDKIVLPHYGADANITTPKSK